MHNEFDNYCGDIPHTVRCEVCKKLFWTGHHISTGKCKKCGGVMEMNRDYAIRLRNHILKGYGYNIE